MRIEEKEEKVIYGISTRTNNSNEMDVKSSKIAKLWQKFYSLVEINYKKGDRNYAVYYNYESQANGQFDVLAGYATFNSKLSSIKIQKGQYLVFSQKFESNDDTLRVEAIMQTWEKIWKYFSDDNAKYKRMYQSDFEFYKSSNEIEIYISIS